MKKITILPLLLITLIPALVWASDSLKVQGATAMQRTDFRGAEAIYKRALTESGADKELIEKLERATILKQSDDFLSLLDREVQKKGDIRISAKQVAALMAAGEPMTMVDIRTPQERAFVIPPKAISIQLPEIMHHLGQIPHTGTVIIICHSSPRAMIATTALRIVGYDNAYALKGGIMSIADINAKKSPDNVR